MVACGKVRPRDARCCILILWRPQRTSGPSLRWWAEASLEPDARERQVVIRNYSLAAVQISRRGESWGADTLCESYFHMQVTSMPSCRCDLMLLSVVHTWGHHALLLVGMAAGEGIAVLAPNQGTRNRPPCEWELTSEGEVQRWNGAAVPPREFGGRTSW
jgi:hypothetical protein